MNKPQYTCTRVWIDVSWLVRYVCSPVTVIICIHILCIVVHMFDFDRYITPYCTWMHHDWKSHLNDVTWGGIWSVNTTTAQQAPTSPSDNHSRDHGGNSNRLQRVCSSFLPSALRLHSHLSVSKPAGDQIKMFYLRGGCSLHLRGIWTGSVSLWRKHPPPPPPDRRGGRTQRYCFSQSTLSDAVRLIQSHRIFTSQLQILFRNSNPARSAPPPPPIMKVRK